MKTKHILLFAIILGMVIFAPSPKTTQAAGCDGANIIFSEMDYDQPSTDSAEFLELYIPNGTTITECEIRFINGSNGSEYGITDIAGTYTAGKYLWLGVGGDIQIGGSCTSDCIQNGGSDGFALVDTSGVGSLVWFYSYEGQITLYDPGDGTSNSSTDIGATENNSAPNRVIVNGSAAGVGDSTTSTTATPGAANQDDGGTPTAVSLQSINTPSNTILLPLLLSILLLLGSSTLFIWRRNHH